MRKLLLISAAALAFAGASRAEVAPDDPNIQSGAPDPKDPNSLGNNLGLSNLPVVSIVDYLADPGAWDGKELTLGGVIHCADGVQLCTIRGVRFGDEVPNQSVDFDCSNLPLDVRQQLVSADGDPAVYVTFRSNSVGYRQVADSVRMTTVQSVDEYINP